MNNNTRKLTRVEMEYDDNTIISLDGQEAEKWLDAVNGAAVTANIHGCSLPKFPWKEREGEAMTEQPAKVLAPDHEFNSERSQRAESVVEKKWPRGFGKSR